MALFPKFPSFSEIRSTLTNLYNKAKAFISPSSSAGGAQGDQVPFIPKEKEEATIPFKRGTFARKNSQQPQNTPPQGSSETLDTQAPSSGREAPAALKELQEVLEQKKTRRSELEKRNITREEGSKLPQLSTTPLGQPSPQSQASSRAASPSPSEASREASRLSLEERWGNSIFGPPQSSSASPGNPITSSPTTSGSSSTSTQVRSILRSNDLSGDQLAKVITWGDGGTKYTEGGEGKKLESPAFSQASSPSTSTNSTQLKPTLGASPTSSASQARTVSSGSPIIQFQNFDPEVTQLAEAAARQARLSGKEARQRADIKADHWKQVEAMRTEIETAQPSVVESFFSGIAKNFSGIGGQTPVEPSTSAPAPAPSNQAIATTDKSPKQRPNEIIPVFATPPKKDKGKENSGQGTSSPGSSNNGRAPFSQNNSNGTGSNSKSASSSDSKTSSSRTGNSSGTQRTSSSITSQKSVTLPGGTKVKGTPAQVEAMQKALSSRGESPNRVADRTSVIEEQARRECSAVNALDRERKALKGAPQGHLPSSVTIRERDGLRTFSGRGAVATIEGGVSSFTDGNGNGGRGGSTGR